MSENKEVVVNETSLQMMPSSDTQLEQTVKNAERYIELQNNIRRMAVKLTNQNDWVNQNSTPYMEISGATKIANTFGVSMGDMIFEKETIKDDKGEYIIYSCMALLSFNGRSLLEEGNSSTRDAFFGKTKEGFKPLSEVDLVNIKKKAKTNMLNRGIKNLLGLSYTWDEIEEITDNKINRNVVTGVTYQKGTSGGNEDTDLEKQQRQKIGQMLMIMTGDDKENAANLLEEITEWTTKEGEKRKGKRSARDISTKAVKVAYGNVKKRYIDFCKKNNLDYSEVE